MSKDTAETLASSVDELLVQLDEEFAAFQKRLMDHAGPLFLRIESAEIDEALKEAIARKVYRGIDEIAARHSA